MNKKGAALLLVLLITVLLSVLVIEFAFIGRTDSRVAEQRNSDRKARWLAEGGIAVAESILLADSPLVDSLNDVWADEFPPIQESGGLISFSIADEDGKINVNKLLDEDGSGNAALSRVIERLLDISGGSPETADVLSEELEKRGGAGFSVTAELLDIQGMEDIIDYVTVYTDGKININTASEKVIQALSPEIDVSTAAEIAHHREASPFGSVSQLSRVPGVSEGAMREAGTLGKVQSEVFTIEASFDSGERVRNVVTVVRRGRGAFTVLYRRS